MDAIEPEKAGGYDKSFHGLIDRSRTDRLYFRTVMFTNHARNGAGNCSCA
jgi:hypothetical protein